LKVATILTSRNRPDLVKKQFKWFRENIHINNDIYLVESGTLDSNLTDKTSIWYSDKDFRGKIFGHAIGLNYANMIHDYDYYLILMNDVFFNLNSDILKVLINQMELNPRMAILSPTCEDGYYPGSKKENSDGFHKVTTCDYLCFLLRRSVLDEIGFLNTNFRYSWGAIHELSYKLYQQDWFIAYSDLVSYYHLGASTYGQKNTQTISREDYIANAKNFASRYFEDTYGKDWDVKFWDATKGHDILINTYKFHKDIWSE